MNATPSTPFCDVPERIAQIIYVLCQTVSMRLSLRALTPEQVSYIVARLLGIRRRFRGLVERIRAGKPPRERAREPRSRRPKPETDIGLRPPPGWRRWAVRAEKPVPLWRALRQHMFAWVCALAPAVARFPGSAPACAEELRQALADPEMRALLMSSRRVGDSLRPLCWMLGVEKSLLYPEAAVAAAPVVVALDPTVATETEMVFATPPAAAAPPVSTMPGSMSACRESPGARAERDFFARV
jgi:hypothetical protein